MTLNKVRKRKCGLRKSKASATRSSRHKDIKKQLVDADMTVTQLAKRIGKARESVSRAINSNQLPTVRQKAVEELAKCL